MFRLAMDITRVRSKDCADAGNARTRKDKLWLPMNSLVTQMEYNEENGERLLNVNRVNYKTNNHSPRKNANKPKRGFFDVGHFNIWADLKLAVDRIENGICCTAGCASVRLRTPLPASISASCSVR